MEVAFENIRQAERITEDILPLKELMEHRFNLSRQVNGGKQLVFTLNKVMRVCLIASLSLSDKRNVDDLKDIQMSKTSVRIMPSFFTKDNNKSLFSALLKLRYKDCGIDWQDSSIVLTSSLRTPKFFVKEFCYFLMSCHQHCLGINLLVQR